MKYVLTIALAAVFFANASAQNPELGVSIVRASRVTNVQPTGISETDRMQAVLDRLQAETQNTVIHPLLRVSQLAKAKLDSLNQKQKKQKRERIRTNNTKRSVNPNRA